MIGRFSRSSLLAWTVLLVPLPAFAQRNLTSIPDPDPEIERRSFQVADGFEVNLFAADPVLAKPIQMNFDAAGRLWLVSSAVYPQIKPGETANDKVIVLEDRDGDGRADRTSIFADGLLIPTGIEPGDGGAYVSNSTELLHFRDTDNDGKADQRRVMLSGFGTEDTHHILHTLRWGYDGMLYFNQSIYIHSHIETPHGVRRLGGGGIWQFRPETMELDVFIKGLVNPWGYHFDRWGQSFATDGAGGEGINYCIPGAYYFTAPGAVRVLTGLNPGSPKYCGEEFLSGRHLPESWHGNILTNDFRGNRVCRFVLSEDGAGFAAREQPELIRTTHVAFRPIDIKLGPDGAVYIADWYNPIIQHGEVDFRDPRRDHTRGRIWRVTAKGRQLVERPKLVGATTESLLEALKAPEDWTRHHAKRVLKERGGSVVPALAAWVQHLDPADPDLEHRRLEALWTYQSLDVVEPELLGALLEAHDPHVRAAAVRLTGLWHARLSDPQALLARRVADEHPRVRLEAVRALARIPDLRSAEIAMRALDRPVDRFLDYGLWLTARELQPQWLPAVQAGRFDFAGNARHLVYALRSVGTPDVVAPLLAAFRAGKITASEEEGALTLIASLGAPVDLAAAFDLAVADGPVAPALRLSIARALANAARQRKVRPSGDLSRIERWLAGDDVSLRSAAARLAGAWSLEAMRPKLADLASRADSPEDVRRAAVEGLAELGSPDARKSLEQLATTASPRRTQVLAVGALAALDPAKGSDRLVSLLAGSPKPGEVNELLAGLVQKRNGPAALAKALAGKSLPSDVAKLAIRANRASGHEDASLTAALTKAGGLAETPRAPSPEEIAKLASDVVSHGNASRGEAVFRRKAETCLKCHAIAGAGGQVGPGLESVGASAPVDYLVDSLLLPNKAVKENYHSVVVATNDGKVLTGIKLRQTGSELVLRDAEDREIVIPLASVEEQKVGGSLMPAGLADSLTHQELLDLVKFLSELGKIGPYSVGKARVARRWRVLEPGRQTRAVPDQSILNGLAEGRLGGNWTPAYSDVSGALPLADLPRLRNFPGAPPYAMASAELDVSTAGPVKLAFDSLEGLSVWVDGVPAEARPELVLDLKQGLHTLTLGVDLARRNEGLRCRLEDQAGSAARVQWVVGK